MKTITLRISKQDTYEEVAQTASYVGKKMMTADDQTAYQRIFPTDEDRNQLERFWSEASAIVTEVLRPFATEIRSETNPRRVDLSLDYQATLLLPDQFDSALTPSIEASLRSFFVEYISSLWFRFCNKDEVNAYRESSTRHLDNAKSALYHRNRPQRKPIP